MLEDLWHVPTLSQFHNHGFTKERWGELRALTPI